MKRDANRTARNRLITRLKDQLRALLPRVLIDTHLTEQQLNAKLGSKNDDFLDLQNEVVLSQDQFVSRWLTGLKDSVEAGESPACDWIWRNLRSSKHFKEYVVLFLQRS
jgi:hypothetical protein